MYCQDVINIYLIILDKVLFLSFRLDDNCLNNLLTSRTEPLKVNDALSHCELLKKKCLVSLLLTLCGQSDGKCILS